MVITPGEIRTLRIDDLAVGGDAVGRLDGVVVFVEGAAPGDEIEVEITEVRKNFARGRLLRVLSPSPARVEVPCPIFHQCGGCQLQHLRYEDQLAAKTRMVEAALRIGHLKEVPVQPCLPTSPFGYRNKIQLVVAGAADGPSLGLYETRSHRIVPMESCAISHPLANEVLGSVAPLVREMGWTPYDEATHQGLLRHVLMRISTARNEALVVLVATSTEIPRVEEFARRLHEAAPRVVGVMINVNPRRTNVILGPTSQPAWGQDHLIEEVGGLQFRIGPMSFFQVNVTGLDLMARLVLEALEVSPRETVVDAYSGVGALALLVARSTRRVLGIEEVGEAVENARLNARLNHIRNVEFRRGTVEKELPKLYMGSRADSYRVGALILDPPRKGCDPGVLKHTGKMRVPRIAYVSCNPATLARDLAILHENGYRTTGIQPVDMFPQTSHVECVARLERVRREP